MKNRVYLFSVVNITITQQTTLWKELDGFIAEVVVKPPTDWFSQWKSLETTDIEAKTEPKWRGFFFWKKVPPPGIEPATSWVETEVQTIGPRRHERKHRWKLGLVMEGIKFDSWGGQLFFFSFFLLLLTIFSFFVAPQFLVLIQLNSINFLMPISSINVHHLPH